MRGRMMLAAATALTLTAAPLLAVDIVNKDEQDYSVTVITGDDREAMDIPAGGEALDICNACTVEVQGVGTIEAEGDAVVTISGGKLSVGG